MADTDCYALFVDPLDPNGNFRRLSPWLHDSIWIKSWANHMPYMVLLRSDLSINGLSDKVRELLAPTRFIVFKVDPSNVDGWLPQPTWDWLRQIPPPPILGLSGFAQTLLPSPEKTQPKPMPQNQALIDALLKHYEKKQ